MTSRDGSATRCRTCASWSLLGPSLSPLQNLAQDLRGPGRSRDDEIALVEQARRRYRRPDAHAHVRFLQGADVVEHRTVVLVVAEADDAGAVLARKQRCQRVPLARLRRMHLDNLAAKRRLQAGAVDQRAQQAQHLLSAEIRIAEVDRGARGLDLQPRAGCALEQPPRLGVEAIQRLSLRVPRDREAAVADQA